MTDSAQGSAILVVDDEPMIRRTTSRVLERAGYRVRTAGSAREALALARAEHFDGVICDVHLPDVSGVRLCQQIWLVAPRLAGHIILTSGDLGSEGVDLLVERNGVLPLPKPFTSAELIRAVQAICPVRSSECPGDRRAAS